MYNIKFFEKFLGMLKNHIPKFNEQSFVNAIFDREWESKELKQRVRHITLTMGAHFPQDYKEAVKIILSLVDELQAKEEKWAFEFMFLPDYIELYGMDDLETSIHALEEITKYTSCEFAVRPFIIKYPDRMMAQMLIWSKHKHENVRRFSTEGCRPRLPWAMALNDLKVDPKPILPILNNLKNDSSEFVRKSVANNLNDLSKDHPRLVIDMVKKWQGKSDYTDWIIKHGSRTLLKQGNQEVMAIFGLGSIEGIEISDFKILNPLVKISEYMTFEFELKNLNPKEAKVRLEYGLYYQKANGTMSKKVFKISEKMYEPNSSIVITRRQHFKIISTRKYHFGQHQVSLILNGREVDKKRLRIDRLRQARI